MVWYYDVDGRDGGRHGPCAHRRSRHPPFRVLRYCGGQGVYKGTLALPDRGSGGRQRGLGGHENFADRDLEEKWPKFFLVCKRASSKGPGAWALPGLSRGSLCDVRPLCSYCGGHMGARRSPMWEARFSGDFSAVYSPEAPLCPPLCHTPATTPVPWPRRCLVVALWWPGRALGLRCGLLKAKNTRFSGISMFFLKMDF